MREETSRQLDKSVVKDWNYQVEFNNRRKDEEKLQREADAFHEKQVFRKTKASIHTSRYF